MSLTKEQQDAYEAIKRGENVFLTGKAGTGKTFVINEVLKTMDGVVVLAPTGTAAINAGGMTIHKFLNLKVELPITKDMSRLKRKYPSALSATKTIIVDEISMCRLDLFDCLAESLLTYGRKIQLVVVGDFCQLPPVIGQQTGERELLNTFYEKDVKCGFAFQGKKWEECNFTTFILHDVIRQDNEDFIHNLNKARIGDITCIPYLSANSSPVPIPDGIHLAGKNSEVNEINQDNLRKLDGKIHTFKATKSGEDISKSVLAEEVLELKIGAKVMLLCNDDEGRYSNGSMGVVKGISDRNVTVLVNGQNITVSDYEWVSYSYKVLNNKIVKNKVGTFSQIPLKLAYAVTIHKSQGQTYEKVNLNPVCWDSGQLYCALSRVKDVKNLYLTNAITPAFLKLDKEVKEFYENLSNPTKVVKDFIAKNEVEKEVNPINKPEVQQTNTNGQMTFNFFKPEVVMEDSSFCLIKVPLNKKKEVMTLLEGGG